MTSSGVELLKYQFSKAIDHTFEQFLDSWPLPAVDEPAESLAFASRGEIPIDVPVRPSV